MPCMDGGPNYDEPRALSRILKQFEEHHTAVERERDALRLQAHAMDVWARQVLTLFPNIAPPPQATIKQSGKWHGAKRA